MGSCFTVLCSIFKDGDVKGFEYPKGGYTRHIGAMGLYFRLDAKVDRKLLISGSFPADQKIESGKL